ncbi:putative SCAN domain-containing protein 3-like [Ditylenchus destructor]|uniref:SCAN domain-containing protein 3-like n=1 Tax=Ditylenchus destructor TaxID=166010 RepID=A0AAD4MFC5_9BILA|nr:putative SCAN domain-containing protein 3-like [Ditylenchus destructor]
MTGPVWDGYLAAITALDKITQGKTSIQVYDLFLDDRNQKVFRVNTNDRSLKRAVIRICLQNNLSPKRVAGADEAEKVLRVFEILKADPGIIGKYNKGEFLIQELNQMGTGKGTATLLFNSPTIFLSISTHMADFSERIQIGLEKVAQLYLSALHKRKATEGGIFILEVTDIAAYAAKPNFSIQDYLGKLIEIEEMSGGGKAKMGKTERITIGFDVGLVQFKCPLSGGYLLSRNREEDCNCGTTSKQSEQLDVCHDVDKYHLVNQKKNILLITLDGSKWIELAENDEPLETSNSPSPARSRSQSPARSSPSSQASDSITRLQQMSQGTWKDVSFEEEEYGAVLDEEEQLNRLHFLREQEREGARKQQKRQAEQMLQESAKRNAPISVGQTVRISIPSVDRAKTDPRNLLGVVMEEDGFYRIGTDHGILSQQYSRNQIEPSSSQFVTMLTRTEIPVRVNMD